MSEKPLVSIIMNCFNGEEYLHDAIKSVINQTYQNWELIFWDNLSTDKSAEIFKSFQDGRLKYYCTTKHDHILYKAKNRALEKANGDFFAFLDVDDWWHSNKLDLQMSLFKDQEVGLVYGNLYRLFTKKNKKVIYRRSLPAGKITNELLKNYAIGSPTYVIRKKALKSLKYLFDDRFHIIGDFDLNIRIALNWKIDCIQYPIAVARLHEKNESLKHKDKEIDELKIWYEEMKKNQKLSSMNNFKKISLKISYLEIINSILDDDSNKSFLKILKYPLCFNKVKLIFAYLAPRFILKKLKNY